MINLMPPDLKQEILFARRNRLLSRWIAAMCCVLLGVVLITAYGQYSISKNTNNLITVAEQTEQRIASQKLENTQKEIETLSNNMKTVLQILNKQLLVSKVIVKIGSILPANSALTGIDIVAGESAIELNIVSSSRAGASQSFVNVSDTNNGLFEKADLLTIQCPKNPSQQTPCITKIKVVIKTDSSFYFLNSLGGAR